MRYAIINMFHIKDNSFVLVVSDVGKHQFVGNDPNDCWESAKSYLKDNGVDHDFNKPQVVWVRDTDVTYRINPDNIPQSAEDFVTAYRDACLRAEGLVSARRVKLDVLTPKHFTQGVTNCARCGGDHRAIEYRPFTSKPPSHTHFGICPDTNEPILLSMVEVPD